MKNYKIDVMLLLVAIYLVLFFPRMHSGHSINNNMIVISMSFIIVGSTVDLDSMIVQEREFNA